MTNAAQAYGQMRVGRSLVLLLGIMFLFTFSAAAQTDLPGQAAELGNAIVGNRSFSFS